MLQFKWLKSRTWFFIVLVIMTMMFIISVGDKRYATEIHRLNQAVAAESVSLQLSREEQLKLKQTINTLNANSTLQRKTIKELKEKNKVLAEELTKNEANNKNILLEKENKIAALEANLTNMYSIPVGYNSFKSYMPYQTLDPTWTHYELVMTGYTDSRGFRRISKNGIEYYCVAMATFYIDGIGNTFRITLDTGKEIDVIIGDIKADEHTDWTHRYTIANGCMLEFIIDNDKFVDAKKLGDVSAIYPEFSGNIIKVERTG